MLNTIVICYVFVPGLRRTEHVQFRSEHVLDSVHATHQSKKPHTGARLVLSHEHIVPAATLLYEAGWILQSFP